jgi:hypothetical protein
MIFEVLLKAAFAVVPTNKICGGSLSWKISVDMKSIFMKTWPTWPEGHIPQKLLYFLDWWRKLLFNKTESFVGKNTSDHSCQIFCSKSNSEAMYHWFSPPRDNCGQNNEQSECLLRPHLSIPTVPVKIEVRSSCDIFFHIHMILYF